MRALCIVNPGAGRRRPGAVSFPDAWKDIAPLLAAADFEITIRETGQPHPTATELATAAQQDGFDAVLVAGGDGTVAAAATALINTRVVLGILPFGSVMNIAHSIPLPLEPLEVARIIAARRIRRVDVGEVAGRFFFEAAGVGLDADAFGAARSAERGDMPRALARVRSALRRESHWIGIALDGRRPVRYRALQILVTNGRYYAWSLPVVPDADIGDGVLDVAVFPRMGRLSLLRYLGTLALRRRPATRPVLHRGREIRIDAIEPLPVHADNVVVGSLPATFHCRHEALAIFA